MKHYGDEATEWKIERAEEKEFEIENDYQHQSTEYREPRNSENNMIWWARSDEPVENVTTFWNN